MSDLLAPLLSIMDNEVDAFWCFAGLMEIVVRAHKLVKLSVIPSKLSVVFCNL